MDRLKRRGADCARPFVAPPSLAAHFSPSRPRPRQSPNDSTAAAHNQGSLGICAQVCTCVCARATGRINRELYYHLFPHMLLCCAVTRTSPPVALLLLLFNRTASLCLCATAFDFFLALSCHNLRGRRQGRGSCSAEGQPLQKKTITQNINLTILCVNLKYP